MDQSGGMAYACSSPGSAHVLVAMVFVILVQFVVCENLSMPTVFIIAYLAYKDDIVLERAFVTYNCALLRQMCSDFRDCLIPVDSHVCST